MRALTYLATAVLSCLVLTTSSSAQEPITLETLRLRVAESKAELQRLKASRIEANRNRKEEQAELEKELRGLARELIEAAKVAPSTDDMRGNSDLSALYRRGAEVAELHGLALSETPCAESTLTGLSESSSVLREAGTASAAALHELLDRLDVINRDGRNLRSETREIRTASGRREMVQLISVAHAAFYYRRLEGGALGIAVEAPATASGFRWTEKLGEETAEALEKAFAAIGSDPEERVEARALPGVLKLPVDPGGLLREPTAVESGFWSRLRSGGPVMWPLLLIALAAVIIAVERLLVLRRVGGQGRWLDAVLDSARAGDVDRAREGLEGKRGTVAAVLRALADPRHQRREAREDAANEVMLRELPRLQRFLPTLALLGTVAPLLGLLGTVTGIIRTFGVIKDSGTADPGLMAGGISEALVTTASGLVVAIPILLIHGFLSGRIERLISETEASAAAFLNAGTGESA